MHEKSTSVLVLEVRGNSHANFRSRYSQPRCLQSTCFTHKQSTSNIHRLVHSSISFFKKFRDSANLVFYIRNINFVVGNFSWNIIIIIRTFRPGTKKLVFIP